jgi:signal transduction histidine kinase
LLKITTPELEKSAEEKLAKRERQILALYRLSEIFQSPRHLNELYRDIVEEICDATGFPIAIIGIYDRARQKVVFQGARGLPSPANQEMLEASIEETFSGVVVRTGKPLVLTRASEQTTHQSKILKELGAQTFIGYPMAAGKKIIGSFGLAHPESLEISEPTARWIESLANYVAALTERKRTEEDLRTSHEQLRELSVHLQSAIEEERKQIAREIHDELGQELSLLQLELGLVENRLFKNQRVLCKKVRSMSKLIDSIVQSVQRISSNLRPALLDNLGIVAAVDWQAKEFQRRTKIQCESRIDSPEIILNQERSTALFRILQETLTNVARHSKATKVRIELKKNTDAVELTIRDNGIGISAQNVANPKSFGLIGMRERIRQVGGEIDFSGKRGKGTLVTVTVPAQP